MTRAELPDGAAHRHLPYSLTAAVLVAARRMALAPPRHPVVLLSLPLLARCKRTIAARIDSAALRGDAACSITCAYMAGTLLVGLALNAAFRWWWVDSIAALALLYWLIPEAREALASARAGRGGCCCGDDDCCQA